MEIIADNLHPKVLKNQLFINAVDYLIEQKIVTDQKGVSERTGITESALSNIRNDKKIVSDKTIRKFLDGFPDIFNPAYFKGQNIYMTVQDSIDAKMMAEENKQEQPQPQIPDYVQRLCDEASRLSVRNEILERQCESLIAELRDSKDKNDDFLKELKKSKEDNDALVAELRISRVQNESLISELRETKKNNDLLSANLENAIESIEGMKAQMSMMLTNFNVIQEKDQLGQLRVNDAGEPVIAIQIPSVSGKKTKSESVPNGFIRGDIRIITEKMIKQAAAMFPPKKK